MIGRLATNANGQMIFTLPEGDYRFRADQNGLQYWSDADGQPVCSVPACTTTSVTIPVFGSVSVMVVDALGSALTEIPVYVFSGTTYAGFHAATDQNGLVNFALPEGDYRFRADQNGLQYWSDETHETCTVPSCTISGVTIPVFGEVTVTVSDTEGSLQADLPVYVFEGETYAGFTATTDANGQVGFNLPQGTYRFRTDVHGHSYWSENQSCIVPDCGAVNITTSLFGLVTVVVQYRDGETQPDLPVYAFNGSTYCGISDTTNEDGKVDLWLPEGEYRFRTDFLGLQFWSAGENHSPEGDTCTSPDCLYATIETYTTGHDPHQNRTINYSYDELYRLTDAEYDENLYFRYQYDAVGRAALPSETREHRLEEIKRLGLNLPEVVNSYTYDAANKMTSLNGTSYTWDENGNLLNDGESDYTYNSANRLVAVTKGETISQYTYNGLGDRVQQIVNGVTTDYVLDMNTGLTQVLQDGTNTYLYGINRVAQTTAEHSEFFLADALGSVRNLTYSAGAVTLTQSYTPFGEILESFGDGSTDYAYTGEMYDPNTGLVFLRARYYSPADGRFTSRDVWEGDDRMPMSYNSWLYVYANPDSHN